MPRYSTAQARQHLAELLNYHVVFGSDVNASDNALAHEATIRTMRRGFARVLDHERILDILAHGDWMHAEARRERERRRRRAPVATPAEQAAEKGPSAALARALLLAT